MKVIVLASLVGSAAAFAPSPQAGTFPSAGMYCGNVGAGVEHSRVPGYIKLLNVSLVGILLLLTDLDEHPLLVYISLIPANVISLFFILQAAHLLLVPRKARPSHFFHTPKI
jgi:hypothetical protein